jgi:hypothetical protein
MSTALVSRISVASLRLRYHRDRNGIEVAALLDDVVEDAVMNSHMKSLLPFSVPAVTRSAASTFLASRADKL